MSNLYPISWSDMTATQKQKVSQHAVTDVINWIERYAGFKSTDVPKTRLVKQFVQFYMTDQNEMQSQMQVFLEQNMNNQDSK